nr:P-type conjugative transfer protein VirB9 [Campylobacter fetus]
MALPFLLSTQALALNTPKGSKFDNRITYASYNAQDVYLVKAKNGYVSMLQFAKDERIVNIATGFSDGWELIDRENFLFIKPKAYVAQAAEQQKMTDEDGNQVDFEQSLVIQPNEKDWKTNLIVTTNERIYVFDLVLEQEKINYKIEFSYPEDKIIAQKTQEAIKANTEIKQEIKKDLEKTAIPRNWEFYMHINEGSETISPNFAYDDGVFTYIGFDNTKTIPSVFMYEEIDGKPNESILNTHIKKDGLFDVLVVHKTAKQILLRSGDKLVGIKNEGYAKNPLDNTRTTISDKVEREIINNE